MTQSFLSKSLQLVNETKMHTQDWVTCTVKGKQKEQRKEGLSQLEGVGEGSQRKWHQSQDLRDNQEFDKFRTTERREPETEIGLLLPFRTAGVLEPRTDLEQS